MAANGEAALGGGARADGEEEVDDEAAFFSLEVALTGHRSSAFDHHHEEKVAGHKGINDWELVAAAEALHRQEQVDAVEAFRRRGDAASEASLGTVTPAAKLRALVRKFRKPRAAPAPLEEGSRFVDNAEVQSPPAARRTEAGAVTADERRRTTSTEAALRYLTSKVPILACRSGVGAGPDGDGDTSPPPHGPRQACRRRLGIARSSVSAGALPTSKPATPRRDDSVLQAQDGVASAIAYCKLTLTPSRGRPACYVLASGPNTQ
ncbi:unnamed protein product [Urochloa humidicola]